MNTYESTESGHPGDTDMDAVYKAFNRVLKSLTKKGKIVADKDRVTNQELTEGM